MSLRLSDEQERRFRDWWEIAKDFEWGDSRLGYVSNKLARSINLRPAADRPSGWPGKPYPDIPKETK